MIHENSQACYLQFHLYMITNCSAALLNKFVFIKSCLYANLLEADVDDIYSREKLRDNILFDRSNNYHPNIELTIEINPRKFLDTK